MLVPLSWLCDFAPFDQPVELIVDALCDLGLMVDGVEAVNPVVPEVVVARILAIRAHPDADRIRLVDVDAGDAEPLQIACGARNMAVGDLVPLARVGAELPGGMQIARRKMRGQWSEGMLCSPEEIGRRAVPGVDGLLILPAGAAAPGTPIAEALGGPDVVLDLDVPANRPDALCMAGVARDLAAVLGLPFVRPQDLPAPAGGAVPELDPSLPPPALEVEDPGRCPRFTATVVAGVAAGPSPAWMAERLTLAGMRPINLLVDASNYVMLELGQPTHAYDLERLGGRGLRVRTGEAGESIVTLDGVRRSVGPDDLLICDADSVPVGVAGVMGAESSATSATTTSVLLEAAYFAPEGIARTGQRLGLSSEARYRFERGVDPELAEPAVARVATLLAAGTDGGTPRLGRTVEVRSDADLPPLRRLTLRTARVNAVLGTELDGAAIAGLLEPIGFELSPGPAGAATVEVPTWRPDVTREIDLVEEVARHHGYRRITRRMPTGARRGGLDAYQRDRRRVRDILVGTGLDEAWTSTFLSEAELTAAGIDTPAVRVANPLDASESLLRPSLLPGLLRAARFNADRQQPEVAFFEIGRVFAPPPPDGGPTPNEVERLAVLLAGGGADATGAVGVWGVLADALGLVGQSLAGGEAAGMHPTRTALLSDPGGSRFGVLGEVDPAVVAAAGLAGRVGYFELDLPVLLAHPRRSREARAVSRYPASDLDLAFVVDDAVPAAAVADTLRRAGGELLEALQLFDVYRGESVGAGARSLAFRLRLRPSDHTLADQELAELRQAAIDAVTAAHTARLRA
jgi:phenylalanyl-tRNA synthetase beta chain